MGDASLSITNSRSGATSTFEANSSALETTTLGFNFSSANDYSVPLNVGDRTVYLRPDQIDAIRMATSGAGSRGDINMETGEPIPQSTVTISVDGYSYHLNTQDVHNQLEGRGGLT